MPSMTSFLFTDRMDIVETEKDERERKRGSKKGERKRERKRKINKKREMEGGDAQDDPVRGSPVWLFSL